MSPLPAPRVVHLSFMGDWGVANWHRLMGFMAGNMRWQTSSDSTFVIHTFGPYKDSLQRLFDRTADLCISSPIVTADMARRGKGTFPGNPHPELRAIGNYPHHDGYLIAIAEDVCEKYGLRTLHDLREKRPPLKLVGAERNGINLISWTTERVLEKYGTSWDDIPSWGGEWIWNERPQTGLAKVGMGQADGLFFEAIMNWHRLHATRPLRFFEIEPAIVAELQREHGLQPFTIEAGYFKGQDTPISTIDFSDWLFTVREDLPDEIAFLMAKILIEQRREVEAWYSYRPLNESPLRYPIVPEDVPRTDPVPLHPGAELYYREAGLLASADGQPR